MKDSKATLNSWILNKLTAYLSNNEGCEVLQVETTSEGQRALIQDAFGFRYSIDIKTISRIENDTEGLDLYGGLKKPNFFFIPTKVEAKVSRS